jgi:hypothetical protein
MTLRNVTFGSINLQTNGIPREIYEKYFEQDNISGVTSHPKNWAIGQLQELLGATCTPLDALKPEVIADILKSSRSTLSADEIERRNTLALEEVATTDGYKQSKGFFEDLIAVHDYCSKLVRVGINGYSGRIHSDVFARGEGSAKLKSNAGIEYTVSPWIWIEGQKHYHQFHPQLFWPLSDEDKNGRAALRQWLISNKWSNGFSLVPDFYEVSHHGEPMHKEVWEYHIKHHETEAYAPFHPSADLFRNIPLAGELDMLKAFAQMFINQLDDFFVGYKKK